MQTPCFLEKLSLKNILSFGPKGETIEFQPLNVLIGPNGSGKSNLIEIIRLLKALPKDLVEPIRQGGGIQDWLWKGVSGELIAEIEVVLQRDPFLKSKYSHNFSIKREGFRPRILKEQIESVDSTGKTRYVNDGDKISFNPKSKSGKKVKIELKSDGDQSGLHFLSEIVPRGKLSQLAESYSRIAIFAEGIIPHISILRTPTHVDHLSDFLLDDGVNLPLVWNNLRNTISIKSRLLEEMRRFNPRIEDITISVQANTVQLFFHEEGMQHPIPATRVSTGTLRYLCLLTILLHPSPPPLICLEEPELGMHPDIVQRIAELLVEASERTQLIVTTHSETLVSRIGDYAPEAVMVCERDEDGTHFNRLNPDQLKEWLEKYSLGTLWAMGEIGGNR